MYYTQAVFTLSITITIMLLNDTPPSMVLKDKVMHKGLL